MTYVFLANRNAYNDAAWREDGTPKTADERVVLAGIKSRVEIQFPVTDVTPDGQVTSAPSFLEMLKTITDPGGVWVSHSPDPAPAWVASDDADLAKALGRHYGVPVRPPLPQGERGEHAARAHHFIPGDGVASLAGRLQARIVADQRRLTALRDITA